MSQRFSINFCIMLLLAFLGGPPPKADAQTGKYVCPPCGLPCDTSTYDKPGVCPRCGMTLVDKATLKADAKARKKAAILIFDGVEIIDFTGPYEMFGAADYDVYTVAETRSPVICAMGMSVVPKYSFGDAPLPDVLVVPGGGVRGVLNNAACLKWIKEISDRATQTMSVCNGAFILAKAGLLDGLSATTTAHNIERLKAEYPSTKVVYDRRFVDNGKIVTAAGLSAGMDGALHVIGKLSGKGTAQEAALAEEYDWHPQAGFARAALADMLLPEINLDSVGTWNVVSTEGGVDNWEIVVEGNCNLSARELMKLIEQALENNGKWKWVQSAPAGSSLPLSSNWKFSDRDGKPWTGTLTIENNVAKDRQYAAKLVIARAR